MKNVFQRVYNMESLKEVEVSDYSPGELVSFLTTTYPNDPKGALQYMRENYLVGMRLGEQTALLLEGLNSVKTN
jgi:hypothetical protein